MVDMMVASKADMLVLMKVVWMVVLKVEKLVASRDMQMVEKLVDKRVA